MALSINDTQNNATQHNNRKYQVSLFFALYRRLIFFIVMLNVVIAFCHHAEFHGVTEILYSRKRIYNSGPFCTKVVGKLSSFCVE
jgi:hypothetical protein